MNKKIEMPKEFGEKWIKALRSGYYEQGYTSLAINNNKYCCLGVACKIVNIDNKSLDHKNLISNVRAKETSKIPKVLLEDSANSFPRILAYLNDSGLKELNRNNIAFKNYKFKNNIEYNKPFTFNQIADFIEDNVEFI